MNQSLQGSGETKGKPIGRESDCHCADHEEPITVTIEPSVENKNSYKSKEYRLNHIRYRLEKKLFDIQTFRWRKKKRSIPFFTLIFMVIYTVFTSIIAVESIVSTNSAKNAFKATAAGVIRADIGIDNRDTVNVSFANKGKGNASKVKARYRLTLQTIPEGNILWSSDWKNAYSEVVQQGEGVENPTVIDGFNAKHLTPFINSKEALRAEGDFTYNDGFGNVGPVGFCIMLAGNLGTPGRFPCDGLAAYLRSIKQN